MPDAPRPGQQVHIQPWVSAAPGRLRVPAARPRLDPSMQRYHNLRRGTGCKRGVEWGRIGVRVHGHAPTNKDMGAARLLHDAFDTGTRHHLIHDAMPAAFVSGGGELIIRLPFPRVMRSACDALHGSTYLREPLSDCCRSQGR